MRRLYAGLVIPVLAILLATAFAPASPTTEAASSAGPIAVETPETSSPSQGSVLCALQALSSFLPVG